MLGHSDDNDDRAAQPIPPPRLFTVWAGPAGLKPQLIEAHLPEVNVAGLFFYLIAPGVNGEPQTFIVKAFREWSRFEEVMPKPTLSPTKHKKVH